MKTLETEASDKYLTGYAQTTKPAVTFSPFLEALEAKAGAHAEPYTPLPKSSAGNITSGDPHHTDTRNIGPIYKRLASI